MSLKAISTAALRSAFHSLMLLEKPSNLYNSTASSKPRSIEIKWYRHKEIQIHMVHDVLLTLDFI